LRANHAELEMLGYSREEYVGRPISDFHCDEDVICDILKRLQAGEKLTEYPARLRCKDGSFKDVLIDSSVMWRDGQFVHTRCFTRDVTDRKRAEAAEKASAERLNLALSAAALGDWSWDAASDVVTLSERAADIFGIPPGPHMTWAAMQELLHDDDRDQARLGVERAVTERAQYDIEYRVNRADGSQMWVAALGRAIYDASGQVQGMYGIVRDITQRKRTEEALRRSEERFRSLMEQAPFSIQLFSPDGRTISVNRAWEDLWGVRFEQIEGYNILEDRQLEARGVLSYIQEGFAGRPAHIPAIQYDPNETIPNITHHEDPRRWLSAVIYPLKDVDGRIREVVLIHEDITARQRAEEALRESERRFRQLADSMPQIVWTARPDGNIDFLNRRWAEFTGLPQSVGNEEWGKILHPDEAQPASERWAASVQSGAPFEMEVRLLDRRRQTYRWHLIRTVAVHDQMGRVTRWFGTSTDIHEQKRSEESSRYLAEASAVLASVVDYESTLQKIANLAVPYFADWSAVDVAESGGLRRLAVAHQDPAKVQLADELMHQYPPDPHSPSGAFAVVSTGKPVIVSDITDELLVQGAKDERHLGLIRSLGLKSYVCVPLVMSGNTLGALTFATAESGRRYTEADLALAMDLANRAAVAIENTQLYQALRETDRRKDEFLATLAHELRNPLAPIRNALQILKMPRVDADTVGRSRDMMERQVDQLVRLVDDLLDVSRVMRGKIELRRERVELATVLARAVEAVQPLIDSQGHELSVRITGDSLPIDADPVRLTQVVGNLLTNAAKYTDANGRIGLTAERERDMAVLRIRDTGIGIDPQMLSRVFELFVQVDHASTKTQGGLGIGLTLVKNLVEMHNGSVEAHSAGLGKGSEFVVRLPLSATPIDQENERKAGQREHQHPAPSGYRLLVVDDNQDAANSLAMLLKLQGHEVRVAFSGMAALEMTKTYSPDLVFLDIGMPGMDGYEVARRLRQQPDLEQLVLAALTGWGQQEDRRRSVEAGFNHHLVKPPDQKSLETVLAELKRPGRK
jgi:PAS domain S-box-containing protein